jgi:hypothetical protein
LALAGPEIEKYLIIFKYLLMRAISTTNALCYYISMKEKYRFNICNSSAQICRYLTRSTKAEAEQHH